MLEAWTVDSSAEIWKPLSVGHFPMYATGTAMLTTTAGVMLIGYAHT